MTAELYDLACQKEARVRAGPRFRRATIALLAFVAASVPAAYYLRELNRSMCHTLATEESSLRTGDTVLLSRDAAGRLATVFRSVLPPADADEATRGAVDALRTNRPLTNVGALAKLVVPRSEIAAVGNGFYPNLLQRLDDRARLRSTPAPAGVPLVTSSQLSRIKPHLAVRTPAAWWAIFRRAWTIYFLVPLLAAGVALVQPKLSFRFLAPLHALAGIGLCNQFGIADPIRDSLTGWQFALSYAALFAVAALLSAVPLDRYLPDCSMWAGAAALAIMTVQSWFGSGPGGTKVNLWGAQPQAGFRVLVILVGAALLTRVWERLRGFSSVRMGRLGLPRLRDALPMGLLAGAAALHFVAVRDLGPMATLLAAMAMLTFTVGQRRGIVILLVATTGLGSIVLAWRAPAAKAQILSRTYNALDPFNNDERRGADQGAQILWGLAAGGWSGRGWGQTHNMVNAAQDFALVSFAEAEGFAGVAMVAALLGLLVVQVCRTAAASPPSAFFFVAGVGALILVEGAYLFGCGCGLLPVTGMPIICFGLSGSAMLSNGVAAGILSRYASKPSAVRMPLDCLSALRLSLLVPGVILLAAVLHAVWVQGLRPVAYTARPALVYAGSSSGRQKTLLYNPRLYAAASLLPAGQIVDREGVPLWPTDGTSNRGYLSYLVGNDRTGTKLAWQASEVWRTDLRGYSDVTELAPLVVHGADPTQPDVSRLLDRNRKVVLSIDARLQADVAHLVETWVKRSSASGVSVALADAATFEPLVALSYPWPGACAQPEECIDRLRVGYDAPGSTFKSVTALAALLNGPDALEFSICCSRLADGRIGAKVARQSGNSVSYVIIHDDQHVLHPHGCIRLRDAYVASCNPFFANLGVSNLVRADGVRRVGAMFGMRFADRHPPDWDAEIHEIAFGQGPIAVSAIEMLKIGAFAANGGSRGEWRWRIDKAQPQVTLPTARERWAAEELAGMMRHVVLARDPGGLRELVDIETGGKTGTASNALGAPHSWWIGYARSPRRTLCIAVAFFNAGYGAEVAAPFTKEMLELARHRGIL